MELASVNVSGVLCDIWALGVFLCRNQTDFGFTDYIIILTSTINEVQATLDYS